MNVKKSKDSIKTGQTFYSLSNEDKLGVNNLKKETVDIRYGKYPNGWFPFCFITLVFIVITIFGICLSTLVTWKDFLVISSGISFCLAVSWWVLRQGFNLNTRWNLKKLSLQFKINRLKITEPYRNADYSINNVTNLEEYSIYLKERNKRSKIFFLLTISLYGILFITFIIISLTIK